MHRGSTVDCAVAHPTARRTGGKWARPCCRRSSSGRLEGMLTVPVRLLGDADRAAALRVLDLEPYAGAQVAERVAAAGLSWRRQDARVFGYGGRRQLESLCWLGANMIPVHATPAAVSAYADLLDGEAR